MKRLTLLSRNDLDMIHSQSIEILEKIGVAVKSEEASKTLVDSGAEIDRNRGTVRIPSTLVQEAIKNAPKEIILCGRNPRHDISLEAGLVHFGPGLNAQQVLDLETGERRFSTKEDVARLARLADALPNIDFVMPLGSALDKPESSQDSHELEALLNNTEKPIICWAEDGKTLLRVAAAAAGGMDELRKRPIVAMCGLTASPLQHDKTYVENLIEFAKAGIPTVYGSCFQLGATSPITVAGSLTQVNAEVLSGLVIAQLTRKGTPFIYGCMGSMLDQYTYVMAHGAPELTLVNAGATDLASHYGLAHFGAGGCTDSKLVDEQAVGEATETTFVAGLCGTPLVHGIGYIESSLTASYEMTVITDEIVGMVKRTLVNEVVSPETISIETIERVGPGGSFLATPHTLKYAGQHFRASLMDRTRFDAWQKDGAKRLATRARENAQRILATHHPEALPKDIAATIRTIVENDQATLAE
jgi:trimethylamine--corrinoid protein Co-methyltransferase